MKSRWKGPGLSFLFFLLNEERQSIYKITAYFSSSYLNFYLQAGRQRNPDEIENVKKCCSWHFAQFNFWFAYIISILLTFQAFFCLVVEELKNDSNVIFHLKKNLNYELYWCCSCCLALIPSGSIEIDLIISLIRNNCLTWMQPNRVSWLTILFSLLTVWSSQSKFEDKMFLLKANPHGSRSFQV